MKFPKGLGFDIVCGLVVTVVLDDFVSLTGTFLGEVQEKHHHHRKCNDLHEFILIQLTSSICGRKEQIIPEGTFCAINIDKIQFIFPGVKCPDKKYDESDESDCKCDDDKYDDKCDDKCDDKYDDKCDEKHDHKYNNKCNENKHQEKWDNGKW
ncbi:MAG: hypothetical protein H7X79_07160 [Sporomusaceae bacterium]|nr:hypothetical protein [Sporomusaceae bacterium]